MPNVVGILWWKYDRECDFINIQSAPKMKNDEHKNENPMHKKETYLFNVTPSSIITGSRGAPEEMKRIMIRLGLLSQLK